MSSQEFCTKCGAELESDASFCGQCGAPAKSPGPITPPAAESEPATSSPSPSATTAGKPKQSALVISLIVAGAVLLLILIAGIGFAVLNTTRTSDLHFLENFESSSEIEGEGSIMQDPRRPGNHVWESIGDGDLAYFFLPVDGLEPGDVVEVSFDLLVTQEAILYDDSQQSGDLHIRVRLMNTAGNSIISGTRAAFSDNWQTLTTQIEVPDLPPYELGLEIFRLEGYLLFDNISVRKSAATNNTLSIQNPDDVSGTPPVPSSLPADQWLAEQGWFQEIVSGLPNGVSLLVNLAESNEPGWETLEVREHHSPESGYDPNVSPMFGIFRVNAPRDSLEWLDVVEGEFTTLDQFLSR